MLMKWGYKRIVFQMDDNKANPIPFLAALGYLWPLEKAAWKIVPSIRTKQI